MKIVTAIVRTTAIDGIIKALEDAGIKGMTFYEVQGSGEQLEAFKPYVVRKKIDLIVPDDRVDEVSALIHRHAHTGLAGDGLIAVLPVECVAKIRNREKVCDLDFKDKKEVNL